MVKQGIVGGSAGIPGRGGQAKRGPAGAPGHAFIEGRHLLFGPPLPCPGNLTRAGTAAAEEGADTDDGAWSTGPPGNPLSWLGITGVGWNHSAVADFVQPNISLASNRCQRKKASPFAVLKWNPWTTGRRYIGKLTTNRPIRLALLIEKPWISSFNVAASNAAASQFRRFRFLPAPFPRSFPRRRESRLR